MRRLTAARRHRRITRPAKTKRPKDPRYLALRNFAISISAFNIFGYTLLGFEQPWLWPILAVVAAYTTEIVFELDQCLGPPAHATDSAATEHAGCTSSCCPRTSPPWP